MESKNLFKSTLLLFVGLMLTAASTVYGQGALLTISGPTEILAGTSAPYTLSEQNCTTAGGFCWNVKGGTLANSTCGLMKLGPGGTNPALCGCGDGMQIGFSVVTTVTTATVYAEGPCGQTATLFVTVVPMVGPVSTSPTSESYNCGTSGATITSSQATGGTGTYTYQWQYSANGSSGWNNISGATGSSYAPSGFTSSVYVRLGVTSFGYTNFSNNTLVTVVVPPLTAGTISNTSQAINFNTTPAALNCSVATGGCAGEGYTYQWQSSPDGSNWSNISGATGQNYAPGNLTTTTYYRRQDAQGSLNGPTNTARVLVYPQLIAGTISPSSETVTYNTSPGTLNLTGTTGGNLSYSYQWYANNGSGYQPISGAGSSGYPPGPVAVTTSYEVIVTSNGVSVTSAPVTFVPTLIAGSIAGPGSNVNYGATAALTSNQVAAGGNCGGGYVYQWIQSTDGGETWQAISGATGTAYSAVNVVYNTLYVRQVTCGSNTATSDTVSVTVNPQLVPGAITPMYTTITASSAPGTLTADPASGGNCGGAYTYQWQQSTDGVTWANISGAAGQNYRPGILSVSTYYQRGVVCGGETVYTAMATVNVVGAAVGITADSLNFVRTRELERPGITDTVTADQLTDPHDIHQTTVYVDGLGRKLQTVDRRMSPMGFDQVSPMVYDAYGRQATGYLPYTSPSNDGNYKVNALAEQEAFSAIQYPGDQFYYGQTVYENSQLNRVRIAYAAGNSWVGSGRGAVSGYLTNTNADSVHLWNVADAADSLPVTPGLYGEGQLDKLVSIDEMGHQVVQYKDKDGHVVLKKVQLSATLGTAHAGWLCTYYVYDNHDNLRFVLQPQAVVLLNTGAVWTLTQSIANVLCFHYYYDNANRMVMKRVPGAGAEWMVYDQRQRLIMTQDSNLQMQGKWLVTVYDGLNRPVQTGLLTDANNQAYHAALAAGSVSYPNTTGSNFELLTQTYYDDYSWVSAAAPQLGTSMATNNTGNGSYFITGYNTFPTYAVPMTPFPVTRGMVTGNMTKVLGTSAQYLYSESFYDDRGRVIQMQRINYTGAVDTVTTQYCFTGKPLRVLLGQAKAGNTAQYHQVVTKNNYDAAFRTVSVYKNIDGAGADQLIDTMQYDEVGRLRAKYLGRSAVTGAPLDSLVYDYNIRSWVTGINKSYVGGATNHYFGVELAYDNPASVAGTSYANPAYNGDVAGEMWKSAGDQVDRKYDFTYDDVSRLTGAAYLDNKSGGWGNGLMDFSVSNLGYDANGNILSMNQKGFRVGNPTGAIDQLGYSYTAAGGNQLQGVTDTANDPNSTLGDFHYPANKVIGSVDYTYDGNGNLITDNNKGIDTLLYNYLNLPQRIHIKTKGDILYTYDAGGNKLVKQTLDSTSALATTTLYLDGFQYQRRTPLNALVGGTDTLQFAAHEEGRARWAFLRHLAGDSTYAWVYDFAEKDHLSDTRVLLSQETDTTLYVATMEPQFRATENALFYNIDSTSYAASQVSGGGFPAEPNGPQPNDSVAMVDGAGHEVGPAILLKVMSGDSISLGVYSYYASNGTVTSPNSSFNNVLNSLASGLGTLTGASHGVLAAMTTPSTGPVYNAVNSFLPNVDTGTTVAPKAYLNWMLVDNQFNYVSGNNQSGAIPVVQGGPNVLGTLATHVKLNHSGYLYIWVSNETPNWNVFFDNLSVEHFSGPMLEETHYYPFGLTMAGLSDKAVKWEYAENKYRFQKQELQNKEFSDGSGLEMYEFKYRFDDCQIGRFWSVDPLANKYEYNSPYAFSEDKVTAHVELEGLEATPVNAFWGQVVQEFNQLGRSLDNMFSREDSHEHTVSKEKVTKNVEVKKSVVTTDTHTLSFGMTDVMEHLTRTNTTSGGPSLHLSVVSTHDVSDKTTQTTQMGGVTVTGTTSVSRTTGVTTTGVTMSGPVPLGDVPGGTLGVGFSTNSQGLSTFNVGLSGGGSIGKSTTVTGGAEASISGKSGHPESGSVTFSMYGEVSHDSDTYRSTFKVKF